MKLHFFGDGYLRQERASELLDLAHELGYDRIPEPFYSKETLETMMLVAAGTWTVAEIARGFLGRIGEELSDAVLTRVGRVFAVPRSGRADFRLEFIVATEDGSLGVTVIIERATPEKIDVVYQNIARLSWIIGVAEDALRPGVVSLRMQWRVQDGLTVLVDVVPQLDHDTRM